MVLEVVDVVDKDVDFNLLTKVVMETISKAVEVEGMVVVVVVISKVEVEGREMIVVVMVMVAGAKNEVDRWMRVVEGIVVVVVEIFRATRDESGVSWWPATH